MYFTYILYSINFDRYYIGHCQDLEARLKRHNGKAVTSTKAYTPWQLVYSETFTTKAAAGRRETAIKQMKSRKYIETLVQSKNH